jgi:hypothetical protein
VHPPVSTDAATEADEMSSVAPQTTGWLIIGKEAGVSTMAFGQVVANALGEMTSTKAKTAK